MEDILKLLRERDERLEKVMAKQLRTQARELRLYVRAYVRSYLRKIRQNDFNSNDSASLAPAASSEQDIKKYIQKAEPIVKRRHPRRTKLGLRTPSRSSQDPAANKWLREWEVRLAELAHSKVNCRGPESQAMYPASHYHDQTEEYYSQQHLSSKPTRSNSPQQKRLMAKPPANPSVRNGSPEIRRSSSPPITNITESPSKTNEAPSSPVASRSGSPKLLENTIPGSPKHLEHHFEATALGSRSSTPASVVSPTLKSPNEHPEAGSRSTSPKVQYSKPPRRSTSPKSSYSLPNPARSYSTVPRSHPPSPSSKSLNMAVHTQQVGSTIFVAATRSNATPPTPPIRTKVGQQNSITLSPGPESPAIRVVKTTTKTNNFHGPSIVRSFSPSNSNISPRIQNKDERSTSNLGQKMSMLCSSNRWGQMMPLVEPIDVDDSLISGGFIRDNRETMDPV